MREPERLQKGQEAKQRRRQCLSNCQDCPLLHHLGIKWKEING